MSNTIAILATLDTKGAEAGEIAARLRELGSVPLLVDLGVVAPPSVEPDIAREEVTEAGGTPLSELLRAPSREAATPVLAAGAIRLLKRRLDEGSLQGVIGLGGLQGTALGTQIMRALPYGLPKLMVSTVASGDVSSYVDIKDVTMMFSVADIIGLNPFTRRLLGNAAGAIHGMALAARGQDFGDKVVIGMSNLGVLTQGALHAIERFQSKGFEVLVFHAIGSGGRAMEEMMKEGIITAVFDYAMGEIADEVFSCLRAGGPERLRIAGRLGLPQVLCPGGAEHLGILVPPNEVPERWKAHRSVFHSPVVFVPRLRPDELLQVGESIVDRLQETKGNAVFMIPRDGTGSYAKPGGELRDQEGDALFFDYLEQNLPETIRVVNHPAHAEDPSFVDACVDELVRLIEAG